jgi:hypothetical protein
MAVDGLPSPVNNPASEVSEEAQYIASRYDGLPVGPNLSYTFETQATTPYDASNQLARKLSPFTLRLVVPEALVPADSGIDVNLLGRVGEVLNRNGSQANVLRQSLGQSMVMTDTQATTRLADLNATLSAGRVLQTTMGTEQRSVLADNVTVADIQYQVEKMLQTPPLTLFINPTDMNITYTAIQQYSQRTRYGKVFERWGEDQPKISISGSTGAWCAGADPNTAMGFPSSGGENSVATGVQFATKRDSAAFQQFTSLYHLYRNNGYIYDTIENSQAMLFVGAVAIDYDQMTYVGNIDSFSYSYEEGDPNRIQWSMEFTVGRMYDHAEAPIIVLPESSPSVTPGSLSTAELAREMSNRPTETAILDGGFIRASGDAGLGAIGARQREISGNPDDPNPTTTPWEARKRLTQEVLTQGFGNDATGEDLTQTVEAPGFGQDASTPLEALGAYFTPGGMFTP